MKKNIPLPQFIKKIESLLESIGYQLSNEIEIFENEILGYVFQKGDEAYNFSLKRAFDIDNLDSLLPVEIEIMENAGIIEHKKSSNKN